VGLRGRKNPLRKGISDKSSRIRSDMERLIVVDGDTVTFQWKERVGAVWNETYEVWEGGTVEKKELAVAGLGKVVDYAEDEMEYEWGRVAVGDCLIRFPYDFDIEQFNDKEELRIVYKGQRWRPDSALGVGDWFNNKLISKLLKGVKSLD
jgi:hypothetical protein